jgi:hypothetical protein
VVRIGPKKGVDDFLPGWARLFLILGDQLFPALRSGVLAVEDYVFK